MGLLVRKTIYLMQKIQKIYNEEIGMYGIIGKENHLFEAKIQKIYSEEIGMCSNDINVEKKTMFWLRKNGILEKNITGS
jgi:hypothetical protein